MSVMTFIAIFIFVVLFVLWFFSFYFVRTGKLSINDWFRNSLGLPRGSVRAILALGFISVLVCSSLEGNPASELPEWAIGVTGSIVGFYFGSAINRRDKEETSAREPPQH